MATDEEPSLWPQLFKKYLEATTEIAKLEVATEISTAVVARVPLPAFAYFDFAKLIIAELGTPQSTKYTHCCL